MESILLLVNSAPSSPNAERAFRTAQTLHTQGQSISMFLLQDAVLASIPIEGNRADALVTQVLGAGIPVYALAEDLAMRGFTASNLQDGIRVANYAQLVDLFEQNSRVIGAL